MDEQARRDAIRRLNDSLRSTFQGGRVMMTAGIQALGAVTIAKVLSAVQAFREFDEGNDPHGEHDFGWACQESCVEGHTIAREGARGTYDDPRRDH